MDKRTPNRANAIASFTVVESIAVVVGIIGSPILAVALGLAGLVALCASLRGLHTPRV